MPTRTVTVGVMTYVEEGGLIQFALLGSVVAVDESDLERFDRYNGPVSEEEAPKRKPGRPRKNI